MGSRTTQRVLFMLYVCVLTHICIVLINMYIMNVTVVFVVYTAPIIRLHINLK